MNLFRSRLQVPCGELRLPAYLPDATLGVVRSVDSVDLEACGVPAVVMNTFHLMQHPGSSTITALGGLHKMCGWTQPIITDSGGFQAYSLIRQNAKNGYINDKGITFQPENSERKFHLTPEKSVQLQLSYGADIVVCLDDCTHVDDPFETQQESVERTIDWARRCKEEFQRLVQERRRASTREIRKESQDAEMREGASQTTSIPKLPLLFGVIQGGGFRELRRRCAEALLEIGFDGFGFGGWPLDSQGNLLTDIIAYTRELVPSELPMHALGVGHPANVVECYRIGYDLFDSAMPTRDARHGRLYVFTGEGGLPPGWSEEKWFTYLYVNDDKFIKNDGPISLYCDCLCCSRYSLGYLHHLFKINDSLFFRLATMHNLRFMVQLMERLRVSQDEG